VYKKSITKIDYETLYKNPDINWSEGIDNLVEDFSKMLQIVSDTDYFYIFQTWKTSGHLSGWDSRVALASFERGMLG
jgi:hypothetical protein